MKSKFFTRNKRQVFTQANKNICDLLIAIGKNKNNYSPDVREKLLKYAVKTLLLTLQGHVLNTLKTNEQ